MFSRHRSSLEAESTEIELASKSFWITYSGLMVEKKKKADKIIRVYRVSLLDGDLKTVESIISGSLVENCGCYGENIF